MELAEVLSACRRSFFQTANRFHWTPQPASFADLVAIALPSPDPLLKVLVRRRVIA